MGTEGMKASLVSRELIADSMELMARGHTSSTRMITLVACDKTIPAGAMALLRMNIPGLLVYGGSIMPGRLGDRDLTIQDVYEAVGEHAAGKITDEELKAVEDFACPGAGACGGQFTANTMALAIEFCGLSAMGTAGVPAEDPRKGDVGCRCGELIMDILRRGVRPRDIFTRRRSTTRSPGWRPPAARPTRCCTFWPWRTKPACRSTSMTSTRVSTRTPAARRLRPGGRYAAADLDRAGGTRLVAQRLVQGGYADPRAMTVTGRTFGEEAASWPKKRPVRTSCVRSTTAQVDRRPGHSARQPGAGRVRGQGGWLRASTHTGPARVFDREEAAMAAVTNGRSSPATSSSFATRVRAVGRACARCWA